jgi:hypothetical protein
LPEWRTHDPRYEVRTDTPSDGDNIDVPSQPSPVRPRVPGIDVSQLTGRYMHPDGHRSTGDLTRYID